MSGRKFILCEDNRSGAYFWELINQVFLNRRYTVIPGTGISDLVNTVAGIKEDGNTYVICFDSCPDNPDVDESAAKIRRAEKAHKNIFVVEYICFEQVILSSVEAIKFFPELKTNKLFNIMVESLKTDYMDTKNLEKALKENKINKGFYGSSERLMAMILEQVCKISDERVQIHNGQNVKVKKMIHHFISKNEWSRCWATDCFGGCPEDVCWQPRIACSGCENPISSSTCSKCITYDNHDRRYWEVEECTRAEQGLPEELEERVRLLFGSSILSGYFTKGIS